MIFGLLLGALQLATAAPLPPGDHQEVLRVGGVDRHYLVHMPSPARRGVRPVVVLLHGSGGSGPRLAASTGFSAEADRRGYIAVYPDAVDGNWNDGRNATGPDDVGFVRALLDTLSVTARVDQRRIFAAGISNGAMFTYRLACDLPGRFAGIATVAGGIPETVAARCRSVPPVALQAFNGSDDRLVPYDGGGNLLSPRESAAHWAAVDGCKSEGAPAMQPDRAPDDSTRVRRIAWTGCAPGTDVIFYTILGGGHSWPGNAPMRIALLGRTTRDISATRKMGAFFAVHRRPAGGK